MRCLACNIPKPSSGASHSDHFNKHEKRSIVQQQTLILGQAAMASKELNDCWQRD